MKGDPPITSHSPARQRPFRRKGHRHLLEKFECWVAAVLRRAITSAAEGSESPASPLPPTGAEVAPSGGRGWERLGAGAAFLAVQQYTQYPSLQQEYWQRGTAMLGSLTVAVRTAASCRRQQVAPSHNPNLVNRGWECARRQSLCS